MWRTRFLVVFIGLGLAGCVTSRVEDARENVTGLNDGQSVVIMAKSYHQGNETEGDYLTCVEKALGAGSEGITVIPHQHFIDRLFPWFEPRTAPADTKGLPALMDRPLRRLAGRRYRACCRGREPVLRCRSGRRWLFRLCLVAKRCGLRSGRMGSGRQHVSWHGICRCQWHVVPASPGNTDSADRPHPDQGLQRTRTAAARLYRPVATFSRAVRPE